MLIYNPIIIPIPSTHNSDGGYGANELSLGVSGWDIRIFNQNLTKRDRYTVGTTVFVPKKLI